MWERERGEVEYTLFEESVEILRDWEKIEKKDYGEHVLFCSLHSPIQ